MLPKQSLDTSPHHLVTFLEKFPVGRDYCNNHLFAISNTSFRFTVCSHSVLKDELRL